MVVTAPGLSTHPRIQTAAAFGGRRPDGRIRNTHPAGRSGPDVIRVHDRAWHQLTASHQRTCQLVRIRYQNQTVTNQYPLLSSESFNAGTSKDSPAEVDKRHTAVSSMATPMGLMLLLGVARR